MRLLNRILVLWASSLFLRSKPYDCPMPKCSSCTPTSIYNAPGIGFDLTLSYGTAAVHRHDGSTEDSAMIHGSAEYLALMQRLSEINSKPKESFYQRYLRRLNKALGRPATQAVGILSTVLSGLKTATETQLGVSLDRVVVTTPRLEALTSEDINDALEYVGLRSWLIYPLPYPTRISEVNAAFAANGDGLCKQYTNVYECQDEAENMPLHQVYAVTFTRKSLYTALVPISNAFSNTPDHRLIDFTAGLDSLTSFPSPSTYWTHIQAQLRSLPESATGWGRRPITKVLLMGESVSDPKFKEALKDAMTHLALLPSAVTPHIGAAQPDPRMDMVVNPVYAAARGAALYARWRQEAPWDCVEGEECEDERKKELEGKNLGEL